MADYEAPAIIASYDAASLTQDAAVCFFYQLLSDGQLKQDVQPISSSLAKLREIGLD